MTQNESHNIKTKTTLGLFANHSVATQIIQNERIRELSAALNRALCVLPFSDRDQVFSLSNRLSAEYERLAFIEGLKLGAQIMNEFQKEN